MNCHSGENCPSLPSSFSDEVSCALEGIFPQFIQFHLCSEKVCSFFMGGPESEPSLQLSHINCIAMCENDFCNV